MTDFDQLKGSPFEEKTTKKAIPGFLNVLTILTFIGSGFGLLVTIYQQVTAKKSLEMMEKMQGSDELEKMPDFAKKFYTPEAIEMMRTSYENRVPLLIITLVGIALCVLGAIQMRALKKQGFYLWLIGEILPFVGTIMFVGMGMMTGFIGIFSVGIVVLFVIMYATQLKHLS